MCVISLGWTCPFHFLFDCSLSVSPFGFSITGSCIPVHMLRVNYSHLRIITHHLIWILTPVPHPLFANSTSNRIDRDREAIGRALATIDDHDVLPQDSVGKPFPEYLLYSKAANGREKVKRDWVSYSKSSNALYCIPCVLFSHVQKNPSLSALNSQKGYKMSDV